MFGKVNVQVMYTGGQKSWEPFNNSAHHTPRLFIPLDGNLYNENDSKIVQPSVICNKPGGLWQMIQ